MKVIHVHCTQRTGLTLYPLRHLAYIFRILKAEDNSYNNAEERVTQNYLYGCIHHTNNVRIMMMMMLTFWFEHAHHISCTMEQQIHFHMNNIIILIRLWSDVLYNAWFVSIQEHLKYRSRFKTTVMWQKLI